MILVKHWGPDNYDNQEYFGVVVQTTSGLKEESYRYRWVGDRLHILADDEIGWSTYTDWKEIKQSVDDTFKGWKELILDTVVEREGDFIFNFSGYKPAEEHEIERYNKLQEQVSNLKDNEKQVEWAKVEQAKEEYERLLFRYKDKHK